MSYCKLLPVVAVLFLSACGGGGGEDAVVTDKPLNIVNLAKCHATETLKNGVCVSVANVCTNNDQKTWVRGHLDDVYLWYNEIKDVPSQEYATPQTYFDALLVKSKDHFSYTANKADFDAFQESGLELGFGATWVFDSFANDTLRVAFVEPNSVADKAGIERGDYLQTINGQSVNVLSDDELTAYLYPSKAITINVEMTNSQMQYKKISLQAAEVIRQPVFDATVFTNGKQEKVGYLLFNEHIATASSQLVDVMTAFKQAKINDLVLDLRFNGGGYAYIANEIASMIGGQKTYGKLFQKIELNDKYSAQNEYDFFTRSAFDTGKSLPFLNLSRVFVLTSYSTCSASEAIINGLSPFIEVIRIGGETCGKPYGFEQTNNCDTAYFAISFQGKNAIGQNVPTTGYAPTCWTYDNLDIPLAQNNEHLLGTALYYRDVGQCPFSAAQQSNKRLMQPRQHKLSHPVWRNNMLLKNKQ